MKLRLNELAQEKIERVFNCGLTLSFTNKVYLKIRWVEEVRKRFYLNECVLIFVDRDVERH